MRKSILILCALFTFLVMNAQTITPGVRLTIGAAAKTYSGTYNLTMANGTVINKITYHIGVPFIGVNANLPSNSYAGASGTYSYTPNRLFDVGFPWGEIFVNKTFSRDYFSVSKGYYSDRVTIDWRLLNNLNAITSILVYRTDDLNSANPAWGAPIKTLSKDASSFDDITAEGGKIYKYKIKALGIISQDPDSEFNNYIVGVGYRNPTGIVTGQISFKGGNPVKDVLVSAVAEGSEGQLGNSLNIPSDGYVWVQKLNTVAKDSFTVQFWMNYSNLPTANAVNLFSIISNSGDEITATARYINNGSNFEINIGGIKYQLGGYMPNGKLNNKGEDLYDSISTFSNNFVNIGVVFRDNQIPLLYINGRPMTQSYFAYLNTLIPLSSPRATLNTSNGLASLRTSVNTNGNSVNWNEFKLGGGVTSYFDDLRIWGTALQEADIRASYKRYLRGNEANLIDYLRFDEGAGVESYDLSYKGVNYNNSNSKFFRTNGSDLNWWSNISPLRDQLGIFGVTDKNGNYSIAAIPFKGTGELIKITPSLGVHKFNPSQESVFIGSSSSVVNRLNFVDESSFVFKGRALYDSRGVFPATTDAPITGDIHDNEVYNAYTVGSLAYPKGEYWAEMGTGNDSNRIVRLRRYAPIAVDNAYVYIDNQMVLDANNVPVATDANGRFSIQVPIGKHSVSVKKTYHNFKYDGRYPAIDSISNNGIYSPVITYYDFFQDNDAEVTFIDTTKVTVVGRVVGGQKELNKPIGFGFNGAFFVNKPVRVGAEAEQLVVSSVNNMGTAQITFGYRQPNVTGALPDAFKTNFSTNALTGEYRVKLLPLRYELNHADVYISSQLLSSMKRFLTEDQLLNFTDASFTQTSAATYTDSLNNVDTLAKSLPYHYVKNFAYLATPQISLLEQLSDTSFKVGDSTYKVSNSFTTLLYKQLQNYKIKFQRQERYYNYENPVNKQLFIVPATQGELSITNPIAYPGSELISTDSLDESKLIYAFKVGTANTDISQNFSSTISANYILNGNSTSIPLRSASVIVLGGAPDGSQAFTTQGPDKIDFILRDPPGSGSYATLAKGSSISLTQSHQYVFNSTTKLDVALQMGTKFLTGIGCVIPSESTNEVGYRVNLNFGTTDGKTLNTTYNFGQEISTSASNDITGAAADVYIGNSTNYFYGLYDNITLTENEKFDNNQHSLSIPIATNAGTKYITKNKAIFYSPNGQSTAFAYSQNYIITELIPTYETVLNGLRNGTLQAGVNNLKDSAWYKGSIDAWKEAVFRNEARKYLVYNELTRDSIKNSIQSYIGNKYEVGASGASTTSTAGNHFKTLFDKTFFKNISIDSKVGSYAESLELSNTTSYITNFTFGLGLGFLMEQKFEVSGTGMHMKVENENISTYNYNQQSDISSNSSVSYVLADNDPYNVLSVDVINSFDGNGPIFIRKGGISSCPAEPADSTHFFIPSLLSRYKNQLYSVDSLHYDDAGTKKVEISAGTIFVEKPVVTVKNNTVYGVPETGKAQFVLTLRNASPLEPASTSFKLSVNPATNPHGARFNISEQGTPISLNGSTAIQYTVFMEKGAADVFDYENIEIDFGSVCDGNVNASVLVSAHFVQSCTKVDLASPSDNWSVNYTTSHSNGSTIPVPVILNGYRADYQGFKRIALQYRSQGSPSWTTLKNYVAYDSVKNSLVTQGYDAASINVFNGSEINYAWDVVNAGLSDGYYEMRAASYCSNGTIFESIPITGKVDLNPPVLFGTPSPTDGILSIGQDIKIKFNEPIKKMGSLTRTEFVVQKNQLIVDHNVALSFNNLNSKATIIQPFIKAGNLSVEFWLRNGTTTSVSSPIISQVNSFNIAVTATNMTFTVGSQSITNDIATDGSFHHYTCTYDTYNGKLTIIEDDALLKSVAKASNLLLDNNNPIVLGGSDFIGKMHELRIWNNVISRETAVANMYSSLNGNEDGLLGDWPMNEGHGLLAKDIARFKHISLENVNWDIFPNTQSYVFDGSKYLTLSHASRSIFSSTMDGTIEFWFKTNSTTPSTIISNGHGDLSDDTTSTGFRNKWSFDLDASGNLALKAENQSYSFGGQNLADGLWHHAAVVLKRKGNISTYIDGVQTQNFPTQGLGGFSNAVLYVGARGQVKNGTPLSIDRKFTGQIDEIRIWNMAKPADQIAEDMYFEQDYLTTGLVLYAPLNSPQQSNNNGPKYYYPINSTEKVSDYATLSNGSSLTYSDITPPIKPIRNREFMVVNSVVNNDEMVLNPAITDWASVEKKIAYITVANMFDMIDNMQESPVTWTAYITKNPLKWYIEGYSNTLNIALTEKQSQTFQLVVANIGGSFQNFSLSLPSWLKAQTKSGTISPNGQLKITLYVDTTVSAGNYFDEIRLNSNYNYVEKIQANLRVLRPEPNWNFNAADFEENMNVIGKVKIDGILSNDPYDKLVAYYMDSVRGIAPIQYDPILDEYFALLTVYGSADGAGNPINFKVWDASAGVLKSAAYNNQSTIQFQPNLTAGTYHQPIIFTNSGFQTQIVKMNKGWTWLSFNVEDSSFKNLNTFFRTSKLTQGDLLKTTGPALFDVYNVSPIPGQNGWNGTISLNGGINATKMYKSKITIPQSILVTGLPLDLTNKTFVLDTNWVGLPYIANRNLSINEAMAYLDAQDGDLIKSQSQFAIYDRLSRSWKGNLTVLTVGEGYMIKTSKSQRFRYPPYANLANNQTASIPDLPIFVNGVQTNAIKTNAISSLGSSITVDTKNTTLSSSSIPLDQELLSLGETMNLIAIIPKEFNKVEFYNAQSDKIIGQYQTLPYGGNNLIFATIYGDTTVNIKAKLISQDQSLFTNSTLQFKSNDILGSLQNPIVLKPVDLIHLELNAFPNPFVNDLIMEFTSDIVGVASLNIYNDQNYLIESQKINVSKGFNKYKYHSSKAAVGNYLIFNVSVGNKLYTKLILKQ